MDTTLYISINIPIISQFWLILDPIRSHHIVFLVAKSSFVSLNPICPSHDLTKLREKVLEEIPQPRASRWRKVGGVDSIMSPAKTGDMSHDRVLPSGKHSQFANLKMDHLNHLVR